jgi:TolA-binding protein
VRSLKADPDGRYSTYCNFHLAELRSRSSDIRTRRRAVDSLLEIAFGKKDEKLAEEALYLAAVHCYNDKRYGESSSLLHRSLKNYPQGKHAASARTLAAWSDYLCGRYADVIRLCEGGDGEDFAYLKAASVYSRGDRTAAKELFAAYLERFPGGKYRDNAELPLAMIGYAEAEKANDASKMVESARRALAVSKSPVDSLRLGWAYEKSGAVDSARAEYLGVAEASPGTAVAAEALYRKAMIDLREGKWNPADLALAEALSSGKLGKYKASALYWRGVAAIRLDHRAEGVKLVKEALAEGLTFDEAREARLIIADFDYENGRMEEAKAEYAKLVGEGATDRMSASKTLSVGKLLAGDRAAVVCAKALIGADSPQWRQAGYCLLGSEFERSGSFAAAVDAYRKAAAEKAEVEDLAQAVLNLGILESKAGELEKADATLKRAVTVNRGDPSRRAIAYVWLAKNALSGNDPKSARAYATVVVSLFGDGEAVAEARSVLERCPEEKR